MRLVVLFKYVLLYLVLALFSLAVNGEPKINDIIGSISKTKSGNFIQIKKLVKFDKEFRSEGSYKLDKGSFEWRVSKPFHATLWITDDAVIEEIDGHKNILDESRAIQIRMVANTFSELMNLNSFQLEKNFTIDISELEFGNWLIILEPKDKAIKETISSIEILGKKTIHQLSLKLVSGDENIITFLKD